MLAEHWPFYIYTLFLPPLFWTGRPRLLLLNSWSISSAWRFLIGIQELNLLVNPLHLTKTSSWPSWLNFEVIILSNSHSTSSFFFGFSLALWRMSLETFTDCWLFSFSRCTIWATFPEILVILKGPSLVGASLSMFLPWVDPFFNQTISLALNLSYPENLGKLSRLSSELVEDRIWHPRIVDSIRERWCCLVVGVLLGHAQEGTCPKTLQVRICQASLIMCDWIAPRCHKFDGEN